MGGGNCGFAVVVVNVGSVEEMGGDSPSSKVEHAGIKKSPNPAARAAILTNLFWFAILAPRFESRGFAAYEVCESIGSR
jgi:hypothetical protein